MSLMTIHIRQELFDFRSGGRSTEVVKHTKNHGSCQTSFSNNQRNIHITYLYISERKKLERNPIDRQAKTHQQ